MTILTLRYNDKDIKDFALMRGQNLTIGRNPDNDIIIDNPAVSGYHARVESVAASFVIRDLNSTNGLFVNNEKVETHALQHTDIVRIGKHELVFNKLVFDRSARINQSDDRDEDFFDDETRFLDTSEHKELIQKLTGQNSAEKEPQAAPEEKKGFISNLRKKILK